MGRGHRWHLCRSMASWKWRIRWRRSKRSRGRRRRKRKRRKRRRRRRWRVVSPSPKTTKKTSHTKRKRAINQRVKRRGSKGFAATHSTKRNSSCMLCNSTSTRVRRSSRSRPLSKITMITCKSNRTCPRNKKTGRHETMSWTKWEMNCPIGLSCPMANYRHRV